jgi:hypothetical protein
MKCKLLKLIRRRYALVCKDGAYYILDKKKKAVVNLSYDWYKSPHENCVYKMIELTMGIYAMNIMLTNRSERRELRNMRKVYNQLKQFADEYSKNKFI